MVKVTIEHDEDKVVAAEGEHVFVIVLNEDEGKTIVESLSRGSASGIGLIDELECHFKFLLKTFLEAGAPKEWMLNEFIKAAIQVVLQEGKATPEQAVEKH